MENDNFEIKDGLLFNYTGNDEYVDIPYGVTIIGENAFEDCKSIKIVYIPEGVKIISKHAFEGCENLMTIYLPSTIIYIDELAFLCCFRLVEVYNLSSFDINMVRELYDTVLVVHNSLSITSNIFKVDKDYYFIKLKNENFLINYTGNDNRLILPLSLNGEKYSIKKYAFMSKNIYSILIPNCVLYIEEDAFYFCEKLVEFYNLSNIDMNKYFKKKDYIVVIHNDIDEETSVYIENDYVFVFDGKEYFLFDYPKNSINLELPNNIYGHDYSICNKTFIFDKNIRYVKIPDGVKRIGHEAFEWCSNLRTVIIPKTVEVVGNGVFYKCKKLVEIYNLSQIDISKNKYFEDSHIRPSWYPNIINIHNSLNEESKIIKTKEGYYFTEYNSNYYLFDYEGNEEELILPDNIVGNQYSINDYAFYEKRQIKSVIIPNGVTSIGESAFAWCCNLSRLVIGESVTEIKDAAFLWCKPEEIYIHKNISFIGHSAFKCTNMKKIIVDKDNKFYDSREDCNAIIESKINKLIFGCENTIIPSGITVIGESAFSASKIKNIYIPNSVTKIEGWAFCECLNLETITIPNGIEEIEEFTFDYCKKLYEIMLPKSISSINFSAFDYCKNLINVYYEGTTDDFKKIVFDNSNDDFFKANIYCNYKNSYKVKDFNFEDDIPMTEKQLEQYKYKTYRFDAYILNKKLVFSNGKFETYNLVLANSNKIFEIQYISSNDKNNIKDIRLGSKVCLLGRFVYDYFKEKVIIISKKIDLISTEDFKLVNDDKIEKHVELHAGILEELTKEDIIDDYVKYIQDSNISSMAFVEKKSIENLKFIAESVKNIKGFKQIYGVEFALINDDIYKCLNYMKLYRVCLLAKNKIGLKNIYKLLYKTLNNDNKLPISELDSCKEGVLIGLVLTNTGYYQIDLNEFNDIVDYVDYVEVVPEDSYWKAMFMFIEQNEIEYFNDVYDAAYWSDMQDLIINIIDICKNKNKLITASSNCKYVYQEYKKYHQMYTGKEQTYLNFRITEEMLEYFSFLDRDLAYEIVVTNTNKIADSIERIDIFNNGK